jgi:glucose 1-dehydrogenase
MRLKGKTALVTGAAGGMGRGIATAFAAEGAFVICADRHESACEETAALIRSDGGTALSLECDVTKDADIGRAIALAERERGSLDILLNGAGIMRSQQLLETTRESFQTTLDVNLMGLFFMLQAAAKLMVKAGRGGRLAVILASTISPGPGEFVPVTIFDTVPPAVGLLKQSSRVPACFADPARRDVCSLRCDNPGGRG